MSDFERAIEADTHHGLEDDDKKGDKIPIRFIAIGRAPILRQQIYKISASQSFHAVTDFLKSKLRVGHESDIYLYLNDSFMPAPEESLRNLHNCFKVDGQLVFSYSLVPAFG